jgi:hypothetical protein
MQLKNIRVFAAALLAGLSFALPAASAVAAEYPWLSEEPVRDIETALPPPAGFRRASVAADSFAGWLRRLPLAPAGTAVLLHDGRPLVDQSIIAAMVDIDTGTSDLQQCADAVMRLRAEFLYSRGLLGAIGFDLVNSERYPFSAYSRGATPRQDGNEITLASEKPRGAGHSDLRRYLDLLFGFASTRSLAHELQPVSSLRAAEIGDVFIRAGQPGHAMIIADMAVNASGQRLVLLVQGSMPARGIYVLNNTRHPDLGAWFEIADGHSLKTPGYEFRPDELRRF